jgi:hypothetical protein
LYARANTPAQVCDRLANDSIAMDSINGAAALNACSAAAAAAPGDSKLQYEYGRALERSGKLDQAKQLYQWLAEDSFSPASAALQRMAAPLTGDAALREQYAQGVEAVASIAVERSKIVNPAKQNCQSLWIDAQTFVPNRRKALILRLRSEAIMSIVGRFPPFSLGSGFKLDGNQTRIQEIEVVNDHPARDAFPKSAEIPYPFFETLEHRSAGPIRRSSGTLVHHFYVKV